MGKGKIIVIEGVSDGIGKTTQFERLSEHLKEDGYDIITHHFPTYNNYSARPIEEYLLGKYGPQDELSPYFKNSLFALDRAITWHTKLKKEYEDGKIVLLDRYTPSSLTYQTALEKSDLKKLEVIDYIEDFEYEKLGIGRPDMVVFLETSFDNALNILKNRHKSTTSSVDIHETDAIYLGAVYDNSRFIARYLDWDIIDCDQDGKMRSIEEIHEDVYGLVKKKLDLSKRK